MEKEDSSTWKTKYIMRLIQYFNEYPIVFIVGADHVGSRQMQKIRVSLRGHAVIMMGKNTMMRKAIRGQVSKDVNLEKLLPLVSENIGFIFMKDNFRQVGKIIRENKIPAPARAGTIAPADVTIQAQVTNLGPERTSFFQALQIPTKITRGTIEIINDINLIKAGEKVGASEAALLNMLNISPFSYGLIIRHIYDCGHLIPLWVLDLDLEHLREKVVRSAEKLAAFSLGISYANQLSAPHLLLGGFKNLLALAVETDVEFEEAKTLREFFKDPSKFTALVAPTSTSSAVLADDKPAVKEEPNMVECDFDDDEMDGLDIFG